MKYKKACSEFRLACESAGIEPAELTEKLCKRRGDSWRLCTAGQYGLAELQGIICENGDVLVGRKLTAYIARQQREAIDGRHWQEKILPAIKEKNNCPDPAPIVQKPRQPMTNQYNPQPAKAKSPFDRG
jgi:hypothetical protein